MCAEESTLAILPVCCLLFFVVISLLSPTCWLYGRGIMTEDGGGDNGTRGQHFRRKYVTCLLFFVFF